MSNYLKELESIAKEKLDPGVFDYIAGGAGDESGIAKNISDLESIRLISRVLRGISKKDVTLEVKLLNHIYSNPFLVAPMGYQAMVHPNGEVEMARGASAAGSIMVAPTLATRSLEEIAKHSNENLWFQLYFLKDHGMTRSLVEYAMETGSKAIVLTVDVPCRGARYRDQKSGFQISEEFLPKALIQTTLLQGQRPSDFRPRIAELVKGDISWQEVEWLKSIAKVPIVLKGILNPEDAKIAVKNQIPAIVVSNHGGRQLDALASPVSVIPKIRDRVGDDLEIFADSGIRSGSDVLRLLCLGASAVMIGRPVLWGLASFGAEGVQRILEVLKDELKIGMTILGAKTPTELSRHFIV
jgi:4-hydroxymandelate oxidase